MARSLWLAAILLLPCTVSAQDPAVSPDEALKLLKEGNARFANDMPKEAELASRRRIELAKGARCSVARIREYWLTILNTLLVHSLKAIEGHVDLAADLDFTFRRVTQKTERYIAHGPEILGNNLANRATSASRSSDEDPILIGQANCSAVDLQLDSITRAFDVLSGEPYDSILPGAQLVIVEGISEREHRNNVLVLREGALRWSTDSHGR